MDSIIGGLSNNIYWAYVYYTSITTAFGFFAVAIVVYIAPAAAHSGIVELQAYLNGVNYSGWFGLRTYLVKSVSVILTGISGIMVGRAGLFAHFGAMCGMGMLYLPIKNIEYFHINSRKREFVSAGLSAGMAVAFGAPVGGCLFGYEVTMPNTYWQAGAMARCFVTCAIGVMIFSLMVDAFEKAEYGWLLNSTPL